MNRQIERKPYPSDLSDAAWEWIAPRLAQPSAPGRPRTVDIREIANAIFYLDKTGCQWDMLPHDFPDYRHVNYYYLEWICQGIWDHVLASLREFARVAAGKQPEPSAAVMDRQSVKPTGHGEARGYDAGKQVKGRKRHIVVDTLGLPKRWIVERTLRWLNPYRHLSKYYENTTDLSEIMIKIAHIHVLLRRVVHTPYLL